MTEEKIKLNREVRDGWETKSIKLEIKILFPHIFHTGSKRTAQLKLGHPDKDHNTLF